ncbi:hypothetical protein [Streptomyces sp. NPDC048606]|uniref:hypothetical protein n=1 Tax=Streptomyces sp. NPDC048606 TaxID=3154726 RepID=UPI003417A493
MTAAEPALPAPAPGLLASVIVMTSLDDTPLGHVAFLLIAHPPARRGGETPLTIETQMRGLGAALGLATTSEPLPDIGRRLQMQGHQAAILDVGQCDYMLRVPAGSGEWARFVAKGGPVVVALGLDELSPGSDRAKVEEYLAASAVADRLLLGKTYVGAPSGRWVRDRQGGTA